MSTLKFFQVPRSIGPAASVAFTAATLLIVLGAWQISRERDAVLADAKIEITNLSRVLAHHAGRAIDAVDLTLVDVVEKARAGEGLDGLSAAIRRRQDMLPQVRNVVVIDRDGAWRSDGLPPHEALSSSDRPYYKWGRDHADLSLHIDDFVVGRTSGKRGLPLSRRIDRQDGSFGGVVVATLAPEYFERFYETVRAGAQGAVALWTADGRLLFRYPSLPEASSGVAATPVPEAARAFQTGSDFVSSHSPFDGIERQVAFQRVEGLPLVVSASLSTQDALATWSRSASMEGVVVGGASIALIVVGLGLAVHRQRIVLLRHQSQEANRRYRLLAENSSDLITLRLGTNGVRSYVSPSSRLLVGYEPDELAVMPTDDFVHPEDIGALISAIETLSTEQPRATSRHRVRHRSGHYVWLEAVLTLAPDGSLLIAARDISARRQAEEALLASEQRFRSLANASSDMIQQLDRSGSRVYVSPASADIFGLDPFTMIGSHPADFIVAEDAPRVRALIAELGAGERDTARSLHRIRHASGHEVHVEALFKLVRDEVTGDPLEIVSSVRDITERDRLQRQYAEANGRLSLAEEVAQLGHWRIDVATGGLTWSNEVYRIHGLDPATYVPSVETAISLYHPDDRAEVDRCVTGALAARQGFQFCFRVQRADGTLRDVLVRGLCELGGEGDVAAVFGTIMDVTELKRAERAALDSESRHRLLADHTTDMITHMDLTGRRLYVSPASRDLLGYEPGDLVGTNPATMVHPDDAAGLRDLFAALASRRLGRAVNVNRLRHRDGRWIWVEASLRVLCDEVGRPTGLVGSIRNIMDRKIALEALQESQARYRVLAEATTDVITQLDLSLRRIYVSPACRHVLGFDPDELMGVRPSNRIHPDEADSVRALAAQLVKGELDGDRTVTTYRTLHKQGHWIWVEAGLTLVRNDATGQPESVICSLRDITERQVTAVELERAKAAAEHAARVKSDFVANMSHELRTPLTGILGVHDMLRRDAALTEPQRRLVNLASDAGTALLGIVNDVLDFSKIEAGQLAIEAVPFDLETLVASCRDLACEGLKGKPVDVTVSLAPLVPRRLKGDPTRFRQVLLNLMTNAVKFTAQGHVRVDVTYRSADRTLRTDVTDTGIGVPNERLDALFDRFTQADTSMTRRYGGTGLGLAICRRLVELQGGTIGTERRTEGGAHFWFELPVEVSGDALPLPEPSALAVQHTKRCRLLLAEDNELNAEIIAGMLEREGYDVTVVHDGAVAVEKISAGLRPDLILMDLQMPVLDGLAATAEIRSLEDLSAGNAIPIVGLTANALAEDAQRCLEAGMNAHVAKPVVWSTLLMTIAELLRPCPTTTPSASRPDNDDDLVEATLAELAQVIGRERLASIMSRFAAELPDRMRAFDDPDPASVARQAHMLMAIAGSGSRDCPTSARPWNMRSCTGQASRASGTSDRQPSARPRARTPPSTLGPVDWIAHTCRGDPCGEVPSRPFELLNRRQLLAS